MQQIKLWVAIITILFLTTLVPALLHAQSTTAGRPSWWVGAAAAANFNQYTGTTQQVNATFATPAAFHDGKGVGLFAAPQVVFHRPNSVLGFMLDAGYDNRKGDFDQIARTAACNCTTDLSSDLSYFSIEPNLRFAPFKSGLFIYAGPRIAFNLTNAFRFKQGVNKDFPEQAAPAEKNGDFNNVNKTQLSAQIGAGYDILLSGSQHRTQVMLTPFISFLPAFGQSLRSVESWELSSIRAGAALKFGRTPKSWTAAAPAVPEAPYSDIVFTVIAPQNIPEERRVRETFPILNYVFFDEGVTEIPAYYVQLLKSQVKDFKEDQLEVFQPKRLSGRSSRQMMAYYNVLNILGDRMGRNTATSINLVGSSEKGAAEGVIMAESVKRYLVDVFDINATRITTEGREKPKLPSEKPGATLDLPLLREGDRRVSIESSSPSLLMQFQSGPDAPLLPVEIVANQSAPLNSYVAFNVAGASKNLSFWSLEIKDKKGSIQNFGPFYGEKISIPGKMIMGTRPEGDYTVTMIGQTFAGKTVNSSATVHLRLWKPVKNEEGMRYSVLFGFDQAQTIRIYEKYLTDIVVPKIPQGATVLIHGYTDIIGEAAYNQELSLNRAKEVQRIIEMALLKANRKDVTIDVYAFGEDKDVSPFENTYPEERFYNRTVIIDILPKD